MVNFEPFTYKGERWHRWSEPAYEQWIEAVDLGQRQDYTAIAAIQHTRSPLPDDWVVDEVKRITRQRVIERWAVRGLLRLPLNMEYTTQAKRIRELMMGPPIFSRADLVMDDTGVGAPVADLVTASGNLNPVRVTLTAGLEVNRVAHRRYTVPKLVVVSNLDARLNSGELVFADDLAEKEALKDELTNFQRHVTAAGRSTFEARSNKHDDIVLAIALGLWWANERRRHRLLVGAVRGLC